MLSKGPEFIAAPLLAFVHKHEVKFLKANEFIYNHMDAAETNKTKSGC